MISVEQMKALEEAAGISKLALMENAGRGAFEILKSNFPELNKKRVLIVAYHGNNGGDGFVLARLLAEEAETDVLFVGDEDRLKYEARANFKKIEKNELIQILSDYEAIDFDEYDIIVDAMLGTGSSGELGEPLSSIVGLINNSKAYKIALDIPTGLNLETGEPSDGMVNADLIITFHDVKQGLEKLQDKIVVTDIGIRL